MLDGRDDESVAREGGSEGGVLVASAADGVREGDHRQTGTAEDTVVPVQQVVTVVSVGPP